MIVGICLKLDKKLRDKFKENCRAEGITVKFVLTDFIKKRVEDDRV